MSMKSTNFKKKMVFEAMSNIVRREIVAYLLNEQPLTAADFAAAFDMTISGAMWHLQVLEEAGIIIRQKRHNRNYCLIVPSSLNDMVDWPDIMTLSWHDQVAIKASMLYNNPQDCVNDNTSRKQFTG